jgi:hypothetical protein
MRYTTVEGSYVGTSDDVAGRWYIIDREADAIDKRGDGWATRAEAVEALSEDLLMRGDLEPVGTAEIAELLGVRQTTVHSWRRRHADFPAPWRTLATGPVWRLEQIAEWAARPRPSGRPRR